MKCEATWTHHVLTDKLCQKCKNRLWICLSHTRDLPVIPSLYCQYCEDNLLTNGMIHEMDKNNSKYTDAL